MEHLSSLTTSCSKTTTSDQWVASTIINIFLSTICSSENSEGSLRKLSSRITPAGRLAKFERERKQQRHLVFVVGVFIGCCFPFFFCLPLDVLCESCYVPEKLFTAIFWLGYCNSLMNPIIYATSSREFKRAFLKVLRCYWIRIRFKNVDGDIVRNDFHTRKMSTYSHHRSNSMYATVHVRTDMNLRKISRDGESPVKSLLIYQDKKRPKHYNSSPTQNMCLTSRQSSYSDLLDDEFGIVQLDDIHCVPSKYSAIV